MYSDDTIILTTKWNPLTQSDQHLWSTNSIHSKKGYLLPIATHLENINASMNRSYELYHIGPLERKVYVQENGRKQFFRKVSDLTILHDLL